MPNDDSAEYRAAQSKHAEAQRVIRTVSRFSNVPPNQVRQAMHQVERSASQSGVQIASQIPRPEPRLPAPLDVSRTRKFDPRPFVLEPGAPAPAATAPDLADAPIVFDNAYVMGTDSTTTHPVPLDDTWDIVAGPPTSLNTFGVILPGEVTAFIDGGSVVVSNFNDLDGNPHTLKSTPVYFYTRRLSFDTKGRLIHIGAEEVIDGTPQVSFVEII